MRPDSNHPAADPPDAQMILCRAGTHLVGVPLEHARESMRPLPIERLPGVPSFVLGVASIRGVPTPVVDVAGLLGEEGIAPARLLTVDAAGRPVALAVTAIEGIRALGAAPVLSWPSLLADEGGAVDAVAAVGAELLVLLRSARLVPDVVWSELDERAS